MHGTARLPVLRTRVPLRMLAAVEVRELLAGALAERGLWPPTSAAKRRRVRG